MPQIKQYSPDINGLQPTEVGVEARAATARRSGAFFNQAASAREKVGAETSRLGSEVAAAGAEAGRMFGSAIRDAGRAYVDYEDHQQISHGAVAYAGLNDALTTKWNDIAKNADPNDPAVAAKFREEVLEPELEKFRDGFSTEKSQAWAENHIDALRNHMFQKTAADMSTLAGQAVATNVQATSNALSNTAMRDPSAVPHLLDTVDSSVSAMVDTSPNLKGADAGRVRMALTEKMKEGIVKAGAIGAIQNGSDPDAIATAWGKKYPEYINGAELKQLSAAATRENSYRRTDENIARVNQDRVRKEASEGRRGQIIEDLYSGDPQKVQAVTARAISRDPMLTVQDREHLIGVVNRELKPETDARISARTSVGIMRMIHDQNADPEKITAAIFEARTKDPGEQGSITKSDMQDLQKQLEDRKTPQGVALTQDRAEFFKRYAATIDPSMGDINSMQFGHHSALGSQKMYEAEKAARRAEADAKAKDQDPHSVYDPSSPNFFGKPENLLKYRASLQDSVNYQVEISKNERSAQADKETAFKPPTGWLYSDSRKQYKDPQSGKVYDAAGKEVK